MKALSILPLQKQLYFNTAILMFKVNRRMTPYYIISLFTESNNRTNRYVLPKARIDQHKTGSTRYCRGPLLPQPVIAATRYCPLLQQPAIAAARYCRNLLLLRNFPAKKDHLTPWVLLLLLLLLFLIFAPVRCHKTAELRTHVT